MEKIDVMLELQSIIQFRKEHEAALLSSSMVCCEDSSEAYWVVMIRDLVDVASYTYSRIARRMHVSPSTIQKLATQLGRKPRQNVFFRLMCLYYRVFYGPYRTPQIIAYIDRQSCSILDRIPKALFADLSGL